MSLPETVTTARSVEDHLSDHEALHARFNEAVSAKYFGATGDGTTDDSADILTGLAEMAGKMLCLPSGIYIAEGIDIPLGTVLYLGPGAVLKLKPSASAHLFPLTNDRASVIGHGWVDGNRSNQSGNMMPFYVDGASDVTIDVAQIAHSKYHGVHGQGCDRLRVLSNYGGRFTDIAQHGVNVDASGGDIFDPYCEGLNIDRSAENPTTGVGDSAIYYYSDGIGGDVYNGIVKACVVRQPASPTYAMSGITYKHVIGGAIDGCLVEGSQIAISLDACESITGKNVVRGFSLLGIELAASSDCDMYGAIDGDGVGEMGFSCTFSPVLHNTIRGVVKGCTVRAVQAVDADFLVVDVNVTHTAASAAVEFSSMQHWELRGILNGGGTGNRGLLLSASDRGKVSAEFYNFASDAIKIEVTTALTMDHITVAGGLFESCGTNPITTALSGGAALGDQITVTGCPGYHATYGVDVANLKMNVLRATGAGTPESALAAGIGSTFQRNDGGAGTSLYVKQSGTGNTGWVGK